MMFTTTNFEKQIRELREAVKNRDKYIEELRAALNHKNKVVEHLNNVINAKEQQADSLSHMLEDKTIEITMLAKENKELKERIDCLFPFGRLLAVNKLNEAIATVFDDDGDEDSYANDKYEEEDAVGVLDKMRSLIKATIDAMGELKDQLEELKL